MEMMSVTRNQRSSPPPKIRADNVCGNGGADYELC